MDDRGAVAHDMERIFGPPDRLRVAPAPRAGLIEARRGHVAAWLAVAMAAIGVAVVGSDRLRPPAPAPAPSAPVSRPGPVAVAPAIRDAPHASARRVRQPPVRHSAVRHSAVSHPPVRQPRIRRPAPAIRVARPVPAPSPARLEAPRLTGEALRRALAADVVITRRLNQQALARDTTPSD